MTKIISIILFITCFSTQAQYVDNPDIVLPILNQFNQDARKHDVYVGGHISKHLGGIKVVNDYVMKRLYKGDDDRIPLGLLSREVERGLFGFVFIQPTIYINEKLLGHPEALKCVIYHELSHMLGLDHGYGIMFEAISMEQTYTKEEWDSLLKELFDTIKNTPIKKRWTKHDNTYE